MVFRVYAQDQAEPVYPTIEANDRGQVSMRHCGEVMILHALFVGPSPSMDDPLGSYSKIGVRCRKCHTVGTFLLDSMR